jgi:hypothetical protein
MYYKAISLNFGLYIDELNNHGFADDCAIIHFTGDTKTYKVNIYETEEGRLYFKTWGDIHYLDEFTHIDNIKIRAKN